MSYGRNFEFRVPPRSGERAGGFYLDSATDVPIGAPVKVDTAGAGPSAGADNDMGLAPVVLAVGTQAKPANGGLGGILVYENGPAAFAGDDELLVTYSDKDTAPAGKNVQVVSGTTVKVVFRNTDDETFLNTRDYEGRVIVGGLGATSTLAVGDYLTPGPGNDTAGYWGETSTAANGWLVVTKVDLDRGEVEARFTF